MKKILTIFTIAALAAAASHAKITLPRIFSDYMVLQAGAPINIWGESEPNAQIEAVIADKRQTAKAGSDGKWFMVFPALKADKTPLTVEFYENSKLSRTLKNALVGEVWIAGGQSNMQFKLNQEIHFKKGELETTEIPDVRFFTQSDPAYAVSVQKDSPSGASWKTCKGKNPENFSAVAYFFAKALAQNLDTPVGIIETPRSGSKMAGWLAREDLEGIDSFEKDLKKFDRENEGYDYSAALKNYEESLAKYKAEAAASENPKALKKPSKPPYAKGEQMLMPFVYYNAKIAPLAPFTAKGVIWYQGESDAKGDLDQFGQKFERLVKSWRKYFKNPSLPFYFVQLPSIARDPWVEIRAEQENAAKKMKNVEMIVAIDLGEEKDVHPTDKLTVGGRLAGSALLKTYNKKDLPDFPKVAAVKFSRDRAFITLSGGDIKIKGEPRGFEVFANGQWGAPESANLRRVGHGRKFSYTIMLKSKGGDIEKVRYLWKAWAAPEACVFNSADLPLAPFLAERK